MDPNVNDVEGTDEKATSDKNTVSTKSHVSEGTESPSKSTRGLYSASGDDIPDDNQTKNQLDMNDSEDAESTVNIDVIAQNNVGSKDPAPLGTSSLGSKDNGSKVSNTQSESLRGAIKRPYPFVAADILPAHKYKNVEKEEEDGSKSQTIGSAGLAQQSDKNISHPRAPGDVLSISSMIDDTKGNDIEVNHQQSNTSSSSTPANVGTSQLEHREYSIMEDEDPPLADMRYKSLYICVICEKHLAYSADMMNHMEVDHEIEKPVVKYKYDGNKRTGYVNGPTV